MMAFGLREPLDDEEREFMAPDSWDREALTELPPATNPGVVLPTRLTLDEMTRVGRTADAEGVRFHEYVKESVLSRVMREATY